MSYKATVIRRDETKFRKCKFIFYDFNGGFHFGKLQFEKSVEMRRNGL